MWGVGGGGDRGGLALDSGGITCIQRCGGGRGLGVG